MPFDSKHHPAPSATSNISTPCVLPINSAAKPSHLALCFPFSACAAPPLALRSPPGSTCAFNFEVSALTQN